jgi:hypothetical protein
MVRCIDQSKGKFVPCTTKRIEIFFHIICKPLFLNERKMFTSLSKRDTMIT